MDPEFSNRTDRSSPLVAKAQPLPVVSAVCHGPCSPEDALELLGARVGTLLPSLEAQWILACPAGQGT